METQVRIPRYPTDCILHLGQYHVPVDEIDKALEIFGWHIGMSCADGWRHATPPDGWSILPMSEPSVFIDNLGRRRLEMQITANSYYYRINPYFTIDSRSIEGGRIQAWVASPDNPRLFISEGKEAEVREAVHNWLNTNFPGWPNPANWWNTSPTAPR